MKPHTFLAGLCLVIGAVSCGGNSTDSSSSNTAAAATGSSSSAAAASSGVVPHEKLAAFFPAIPGFKRETEPQGDTDNETKVSRVEANYVQEGGVMGGLSLEMMDVSTNSMMLAAFKEIQRHQGTTKTAAGTQKAITIAGFPAFEEWTPEAGNGVLGVLLSDRFVVTLTGNSIGNVSVLYKAMDAIDLKKIAALK